MVSRQTMKMIALAGGMAVMLLLFACGGDSQADTREVSVNTFLTATTSAEPAGSAPDITPTPTFRPTEVILTPAELDRTFEDTRSRQQRREFLVEERVRPAVNDQRVIDAMLAVPRHAFVPTDYLDQAYNDYPLPIGYGQTISQPSLVAMMTEMLDLQPGDSVLEIGTGSGYQAAILREMVDEVYTVEIIPELAGSARRIFNELGYQDIHTLRADGYYGWWKHAPYDAIIVTAAPDHLPSPLVAQLDPDGGRMVIPIGPPGGYQSLWLLERQGEDVSMERVMDVAFVPFTREQDE